MLTISPLLSLGIILTISVIEIVQHQFYKSQRKLYRKYDVAMRSANSVLSDVMNGQRVVKAFAREDREIERYRVKNTDAFLINSRINSRIANTIPVIWTFYRIVNKLVFCLGAVLVIKGHITIRRTFSTYFLYRNGYGSYQLFHMDRRPLGKMYGRRIKNV